MPDSQHVLETQLNDFDPQRRREALEGLMAMVKSGAITLPEPDERVNLHSHTFFSFNGYGYSPSYFAWKARCEGLAVAGVVDFDVLEATDEFLAACRLVGLRCCAGVETRAFIAEFETREINSPGEPGVAYAIGMGFTTSQAPGADVLAKLLDTATQRTRAIVDRVNPHTAPVILDYEADVASLTPKGNATERHVCMAYEAKGIAQFPDADERAAFWAGKLGLDAAKVKALFDDSPGFQGTIRSKLMKRGGVGYVQPQGPDFPALDEFYGFILGAGALPVVAWLDGLTEGELATDELFDLLMSNGAAALNIVPDRNWNLSDPEVKKKKVEKLHEIVAIAQKRGLPVFVGTEMNAHGQKFVDDFDVPEMAPLAEAFLEGAHIIYGHTALQAGKGMGYLSKWAQSQFDSVHEKNAFFAEAGRRIDPANGDALAAVTASMNPAEVLGAL